MQTTPPAAPEGEAAMLIPPPATGEPSSIKQTASTILMFAGLVLLGMTIWRMLRKSWRARQRGGRVTKYEEPGMTAQPRLRMAEIEQRAAKRDEIDGMMSDAEEIVRRLVAHLEAKSIQLEVLMDRAEACAERLERAAATMDSSVPIAGRGEFIGNGNSDIDGNGHGKQERGRGVAGDARHAASGDRGLSRGTQPLEREIGELADQGLTAVEIATRLQKPIGQVELVLALRRRTSA